MGNMPRERDREAREAREARRTHRHATRRHHDRPDRDARRAERREGLLDAAVEVIRREGPFVSMEAIAAEAGVTKPIIYRHFGDRDGLVTAVATRFADGLITELRESLRRQTEPRELLVGTIDAYLAFVERDPQVYRFLGQRAPVDAASAAKVQGFVRQVAQEVSLVMGERLRLAGVDSGAAEPWAFGLVGMVQFAGDWWIEHRSMPRARLVEYLTQLVWDGLAAVPEPGTTAEVTA
jgi:AcrR family transcriptional regulator